MAEICLPRHKCGLFLEHNVHRDYYESVEQALQSGTYDAETFVDGEIGRAIERDEVWVMQWYPDTPIGYHRISAGSLDALNAAVKKHEEGDDS